MEVTLKRLDDAFHLVAINEDGNTVETDGAPEIGGHQRGMRPMQLVLSALGSCSAIDVIQFLKKMRQPLLDIQMRISAQREKDVAPALFTDIHLHYVLHGPLDSRKVERAISLSVDKYCSVARLLDKTASITWDYEIHYDD
mgnify:CR=1 FL=1